MKLFPLAVLVGVLFTGATDEENKTPQNLTVLKDTGKTFHEGMRAFRKGLGGDCNGCHEKGAGKDSDKNPNKDVARTFLRATVGQKDPGKRAAALKALLTALKKDAPADEAELWRGIDLFVLK